MVSVTLTVMRAGTGLRDFLSKKREEKELKKAEKEAKEQFVSTFELSL